MGVNFAYNVFTFGKAHPQTLRRHLIELSFVERTFSIERASDSMGYVPLDDREMHIREGVRRCQQHRT